MFYTPPLPPIPSLPADVRRFTPHIQPFPLQISQQQSDLRTTADQLYKKGSEQRDRNQLEAAIPFFKAALAIYQQLGDRATQGGVLADIGSIYYRLEKYDLAVKYYEQSWDISRHLGPWQELRCLYALGDSHRILGNYARAANLFQRLIVVLRQIDKPLEEAVALRALGNTLFQMGNFVKAEQVLRDGIAVLESYWQDSVRFGDNDNPGEADFTKAWFFEYQAPIYGVLQKVLVAQKKYIEALEVSERGRNRAFITRLTEASRSHPDSLLSSPLSIAQRIRAIAKNHQATLVQYSVISEQSTVAGMSKEQEAHLFIWVIQPHGEIIFRSVELLPSGRSQNSLPQTTPSIANPTQLTQLIQNTRSAIRGIGLVAKSPPDGAASRMSPLPIQADPIRHQLQRLHQLLIQPIADLLPTDPHQKIFLIPHRSLLLVPFAALKDADGHYLIEKHTLVIAPSMQTLAWTQEQQQRTGQTKFSSSAENLVVGNPTMPRVTLAPDQPARPLMPLPGAELEAKAIATLLHTQPLLGSQATEARVVRQMSTARIIHLATHGLLDDIEGFRSSLALAPTPTNDGLLHADEIMGMRLNAELVVLSACDTGGGRVLNEGIMGLPRSLLVAGVPSVIVSLWAVPDAPTASLMTRFYQNLQQQPDKAQALREAMLATLKQYPNPVDWAAFTLIGEP